MPQLIRDLLRDVFYEIIKPDQSGGSNFNDIDKFMMTGKQSFKLVLAICKKADNVVIFNDRIVVKFPNVIYVKPQSAFGGWRNPTTGTEIFSQKANDAQNCPEFLLFKPISIALASSLTSLDIRSFSPVLIPMLKAIDQEMAEVDIRYIGQQVNDVLTACVNIPKVQKSVNLQIRNIEEFVAIIIFFAIPCHRLTITKAHLHSMCPCVKFSNSHLHNISDLTIFGEFFKTNTLNEDVKDFATFLTTYFSNLKALNISFIYLASKKFMWDWNKDGEMANYFKALRLEIKGSITFKVYNRDAIQVFNAADFPDVQRDDKECYKILKITDTLTFKLAFSQYH